MKIGLYVINQVINQIKMDSLRLLFKNQAGGGERGEVKTERGRQHNGPVLTRAKEQRKSLFQKLKPLFPPPLLAVRCTGPTLHRSAVPLL